MSAEDTVKVDAIVVGGGPGGLAAALTMAQGGLEVILVERGEYAGSKNVGGLFYGTILNQLIPDAFKQAPIERTVSKRSITYLGDGTHMSLTFGADAWSQPPYNNTYVVHRAQFDRWLASQVEEAGATLLEGMVVDGLIYEGEGAGRKAVGVQLRGDEAFYADVIVLADGANCLVSEKVREELAMPGGKIKQEYAVGVKEIISLPKETIEARFNLKDNEGVAYDFLGVPFEGLIGGGFIYTAKDSIHLGSVARIESLVESGFTPSGLNDRFKQHPAVSRLIDGGELLEYSGHMLPEGGYDAIGSLTANGVMIVGDAAGLLNMSLYKEGTNHAMESGMYAGQAAVAAKEKKDYSRSGLALYEEKLAEGIALKDVKKYKDLPDILTSAPELLSLYPKKINQLMVDYFTVNAEPKAVTQKAAMKNFMKDMSKIKLLRNAFKARKLM
ncbi:MAG: FAD-dependent oxidoreductase [Verrucomicrobia bacterium]|nr:FAD-dependent oxidoreductase [Verrucomicrobiota bacterium]